MSAASTMRAFSSGETASTVGLEGTGLVGDPKTAKLGAKQRADRVRHAGWKPHRLIRRDDKRLPIQGNGQCPIDRIGKLMPIMRVLGKVVPGRDGLRAHGDGARRSDVSRRCNCRPDHGALTLSDNLYNMAKHREFARR